MTDPPSQPGTPADILRSIDRLCDSFETQWQTAEAQQGERPRIETFLARLPAAHQAVLLGELLPLDADYRRLSGETPTPDDYLGRGLHSDEGFVEELATRACRLDSLHPGSRFSERDPSLAALLAGDDAPHVELSCADVFERLRSSTLISSEDLTQIEEVLASQRKSDDLLALREELARRGLLTEYQLDELVTAVDAKLTVGRYVLLDRLSRGGMGTVFKAVHRDMDRIVALKVLNQGPHLGAQAFARFQREVRLVANLSHPNIVTAFDAGKHRGRPYLAMEYIEGENLDEKVAREGALPPPVALDIATQAAEALAYAHQQGVIHRDVKPANLMLDGKGRVKLLDLGLSRLCDAVCQTADSPRAESRLTRSTMLMGTPEYMAPEQASDLRSADHRVDVYSLGRTLVFLLVGRRVFTRLHGWKAAGDSPPRPALLPQKAKDSLPRGWEMVLLKMIADAPEQRFQSMQEVLLVLRGLQTKPPHGEPASNATPTLPPATHLTKPPPITQGGNAVAMLSPAMLDRRRRTTRQTTARGARHGWWLAPLLVAAALVFWKVGYANFGAISANVNDPLSGVLDESSRDAPESTFTASGRSSEESPSPRRTPEPPEAAMNPAEPRRDALTVRSCTAAEAPAYQRQWSRFLSLPVKRTNLMGMQLVLIPPGVFQMGTDREDALRLARRLDKTIDAMMVRSEAPSHEVRISRPFYLARHEVTIAQYRQFVEARNHQTAVERNGRGWLLQEGKWRIAPGGSWNSLGEQPLNDDLAAINLAWEDAVAFCQWLSEEEAMVYRLPTEAEWEYACRAGSQSLWFFGDDGSQLRRYAWCGGQADTLLRAVGEKEPNAWGLLDMLGNAREWCGDPFHAQYYRDSPEADPQGPAVGRVHVQRGGAVDGHPAECRSAARFASRVAIPAFAGFRVVCETADRAKP